MRSAEDSEAAAREIEDARMEQMIKRMTRDAEWDKVRDDEGEQW